MENATGSGGGEDVGEFLGGGAEDGVGGGEGEDRVVFHVLQLGEAVVP